MSYSGYANRQTWNVALWMSNDEFLYSTAKACVRYCEATDTPYAAFIRCMENVEDFTTGDGIRWDDKSIDLKEIHDVMLDLAAD